MMNLAGKAEQQKNQRAENFKNRILKQTHDIQILESFKPITMKLSELDDYTEKVTQDSEKPDSGDGSTETPSIKV